MGFGDINLHKFQPWSDGTLKKNDRSLGLEIDNGKSIVALQRSDSSIEWEPPNS